MAIKMETREKDIKDQLAKMKEITHEEVLKALAELGADCNRRIRERSQTESWINRTGNLRSSIGYAIFDHGKKIIESEFAVVLNGTEGPDAGHKAIMELAKEYANTYGLVVVAGMSYAEYVEKHKSKDVLASTSLWAEKRVEEYLRRAKKNAESRINKILR